MEAGDFVPRTKAVKGGPQGRSSRPLTGAARDVWG